MHSGRRGGPDEAPNTRLAVVRKKQSITKTAPAQRAMLMWAQSLLAVPRRQPDGFFLTARAAEL
jgi:hypothetical protein